MQLNSGVLLKKKVNKTKKTKRHKNVLKFKIIMDSLIETHKP